MTTPGPTLIERDVPMSACTVVPGRRVLGICLHHTAGPAASTPPFPQAGASWHYLVLADGTVYADVSPEYAAHHVRAADRWRPPWLPPAPPNAGVSDVNAATIGIELHYAPQAPFNEVPSLAQHAALRDLLRDLNDRYGGHLPVVGHGQLQLDRWPTEPHGLRYDLAGLGEPIDGSRYYTPPAPAPDTGETEDDMATAAELQGIIDEQSRQIAALREEIAGLQSANGALTHDVLVPLQEELAAVKRELQAAQAAASAELQVAGASLSVQMTLADGRQISRSVPLQ